MKTTTSSATGEALRDAALDLLHRTRPALIRDLQRAAVWLALTRDEFTADGIRDAVVIPDGIDPVVVGAAVRALAVAGILTHVGYRRSVRPVAHRRPVSVWTLADRAAALAWLAANPALTVTD